MIFNKLFKLNETQKIYKNFIAFNVSFILIFAAFDDIAMIASVLNQNESLGNGSQAILYITQFLTAFVWPQVFIEIIGFKFTMILAQIFYFIFFAANAYPRWYTLGPASLLVGFGNSIAWTTLGIYFTLLSKRYSVIKKIPFINAQTLFFGLFGAMFLTNYIFGAIWIGAILQLKDLNANSNFTYSLSCGANNCPKTILPESASKPTITSVYILCGTLNGACLLAIIITLLFVDDLKYDEDLKPVRRGKVTIMSIKNRFKVEFGNLYDLSKQINIWLLLPIALFLGYELTLMWFEFYRAFVACLKNANYIGWISILFGGAASIISIITGFLAKYIGLQTTMVMMLMAALGNAIFMLSWTPSVDESYVLYIMAIVFAFTDCLSTTQVRAAFGIFFPDNPSAYSAAILFETIGLIIGSVLSIYFCTRIKVYVYIFIIILSILTYVILEVKTNYVLAKNNSEKSHQDTSKIRNRQQVSFEKRKYIETRI